MPRQSRNMSYKKMQAADLDRKGRGQCAQTLTASSTASRVTKAALSWFSVPESAPQPSQQWPAPSPATVPAAAAVVTHWDSTRVHAKF